MILLSAGLTLIACLLGTKSASADTPPTGIRTMSPAAPAMVLGVTNPYLIAAAMKTPEVQGFTLSQDIRDLAKQVEKLARFSARAYTQRSFSFEWTPESEASAASSRSVTSVSPPNRHNLVPTSHRWGRQKAKG
jgi:hypothetical protein